MIAAGIPSPLKTASEDLRIYALKRDSSTTSVGSRQPMRKRNIHAFDAVDGSSHRHRERLLAVPSGLIEQHDGVGILRVAGGAIEGYVHGLALTSGRTSAKASSEALVGEARRTLAPRSCVCIGRDPGGRKQNEKGFHNLTQARREHRARLQRSGAQAV